MGPFSFLLTYTHTHMTKFISTIGKKWFTAICVIVFLGLFLVTRFAFATEPTPKERAVAEYPNVLREKARTEEYHLRYLEAENREKQILACMNTDDCEGF